MGLSWLYHISSKLFLVVCLVGSCITFGLLVLATPLPAIVCALFALLLWGGLNYWLEIARLGARTYAQVAPWQETVEPDDGHYGIPEKDFDRLRHLLQEVTDEQGTVVAREDQVRRVWRQHPVALVSRLTVPVLLTLLFVALAALAMVEGTNGSFQLYNPGHMSSPATPTAVQPTTAPATATIGFYTVTPPSSGPGQHGLPPLTALHAFHPSIAWWHFLLLAVLSVIAGWVLCWKWMYTVFFITNLRVIRAVVPPPLLKVFMKNEVKKVDLYRIDTVEDRTAGLGQRLNYGEVGLDTESTVGDIAFNSMPYTPHAEITAQILDNESMRLKLSRRTAANP